MKKKSFHLLLCALAVAMLCPLLFACGSRKEPVTNDATVETQRQYRDDITQTFPGQEIHFISRVFDWYRKEVTVAQDDLENPVDEAVYARQLEVEQRLDVLIENKLVEGTGTAGYSKVVEAVINDVSANTHLYDIAVNNMYHTMEVVSDGMFMNLYEVPNLTLSKPYYSQYYNEQATVSNKLYSTTGDASLTFIRFAMVTFFNKKIQADYKLENFYEVVEDGDWTMDYQLALVRDLYADKNGNGEVDEDDLFGFITNKVTGVDPYTSALQMNMVGRDDSGKLVNVVEGNLGHFSDALEKVLNLYAAEGTYILAHQKDDGEFTKAKEMFSRDRALFTTLRLDACEDYLLRNMTSDYGVLPIPKFSAEQEQYYSYCHDLFSVYCVCSNIEESRLPAVGAALEVFFSHSEKCRHYLFEVALKVKYQRSEEASRILDLVIDNVKIDTGWIYSGKLSDFALVFRDAVEKESKNFNGYWRAQGPGFVILIQQLQELFDREAAAD